MSRLSLAILIVLFVAAGIGLWLSHRGDADDLVSSGWELTPPLPNAVPVAANNKLPGIYPAGSRTADDRALGGFGPCNNWPKNLGDKGWGTKGAVALVAFPEEPVAYFKHRGIAVRLVNRSGEVVPFTACDSQLYMVQQALDEEGQWREVEEFPETFCGNSFHRVFLKPDQYWEFKARTYSGPIKTRIRFRLDPTGENGNGQPIFSNEFEGQIAKSQFRKE